MPVVSALQVAAPHTQPTPGLASDPLVFVHGDHTGPLAHLLSDASQNMPVLDASHSVNPHTHAVPGLAAEPFVIEHTGPLAQRFSLWQNRPEVAVQSWCEPHPHVPLFGAVPLWFKHAGARLHVLLEASQTKPEKRVQSLLPHLQTPGLAADPELDAHVSAWLHGSVSNFWGSTPQY